MSNRTSSNLEAVTQALITATSPLDILNQLASFIRSETNSALVLVRFVQERGSLIQSVDDYTITGHSGEVDGVVDPWPLLRARCDAPEISVVAAPEISTPALYHFTADPPLPELVQILEVPYEIGTVYIILVPTLNDSDPGTQSTVSLIVDVLHLSLAALVLFQKHDSSKRKESYFEDLLKWSPSTPEEQFLFVCDVWRKYTEAEWVWLWLFNQYKENDAWEISAVAPADGENIPDRLHASSRHSVVEYCIRTQKPVYITDIKNWRAEFEGTEFSVAFADEFVRQGCTSFLSIPLLQPISPNSPEGRALNIRGVICIHYRTPPKSLFAETHLLCMGRLTASKILTAYHSEQRELLLELNILAARFLTAVSRRPREVRDQYFRELFSLLQRRLHIKGLSLFHFNWIDERLHCIATTGLLRADSVQVAAEDSRYQPDEGFTGKCFKSGEALVFAHGEDTHTPKYIEKTDATNPLSEASVLMPVRASIATPQATTGGDVIGVLRCTGHGSPIFRDRPTSFNVYDVQTIGFIAQQIGPVIATLCVNVQREERISIIKHDLVAPLRMISDTSDRIKESLNQSEAVPQYALDDICMCAALATNLVTQLDPHPTEIREFEPSMTFLEGEIIARLKAMLQNYARATNRMGIVFSSFEVIPKLRVDRVLVERAFTNIIINAIKYGQPGTNISVTARRGANGYYVDVSNYGLGILPNEEKQIFKTNYRAPRAQELRQGLGLGLSIARAAMERHNGRLFLTALRDPTVFTFFFPKELAL